MQLNDAHVFCQPADIATEVAAILDMIGHAYDALGITADHYRLSLRGDTARCAGDTEMWDRRSRPWPRRPTGGLPSSQPLARAPFT